MLLLNPLPQRLDSGATPTFAGLLAADGTAAAPSISFASDSNTGFYNVSSGNVAFSSDGATSLYFGAGGIIQAAGFTGYLSLAASGAISFIAGGTNRNIALTPSGSGSSVVDSVAGQELSVLFNQNGSTKGSLITSGGDVLFGATGATNLIFRTNATERCRILPTTGRFLIGTTTDSANGILQLATHTASTGGIGFGTDISVYRVTSALLAIDSPASATTTLDIKNSSGTIARIQASSTSMILASSGTTALTLDSSQRTILAGALRLNNAYVAGAVVGTGYVTIQDSTGTTYRIPVLV